MSQILRVPSIGQKADLSHPINKELFSWFPMNQGFQDIAKNNINVASVEGDVKFWSRPIGISAYFDGTDDALILPNGTAGGKYKVSVSAWFHVQDLSTARPIYTETIDAAGKGRFDVGPSVNGTLRIAGRRNNSDGFTTFCLSDTNVVSNDQWYFGTWVYDAKNTHKVYVNGRDVTSSANVVDTPFETTTPYEVTIGANGPRSTRYQGSMNNVRIWNRTLTDNEVMQLYQDPWIGLEEPSTTKYFLPISTIPVNRTYVSVRNKLTVNSNGRFTIYSIK